MPTLRLHPNLQEGVNVKSPCVNGAGSVSLGSDVLNAMQRNNYVTRYGSLACDVFHPTALKISFQGGAPTRPSSTVFKSTHDLMRDFAG